MVIPPSIITNQTGQYLLNNTLMTDSVFMTMLAVLGDKEMNSLNATTGRCQYRANAVVARKRRESRNKAKSLLNLCGENSESSYLR